MGITTIESRAGVLAFAAGQYRGSCVRVARTIWLWKVWDVVGPVTLAEGHEHRRRDARHLCLKRLAEAGGETTR